MHLTTHLLIVGTILGAVMAEIDPNTDQFPCYHLRCLAADGDEDQVCKDALGVPDNGNQCCMYGNRAKEYGTFCYNHGGRAGDKGDGVVAVVGLGDAYCAEYVDQCKNAPP